MTDPLDYAVFPVSAAFEALCDVLQTYLGKTLGGAHIVCSKINVSDALFELAPAEKGRMAHLCN